MSPFKDVGQKKNPICCTQEMAGAGTREKIHLSTACWCVEQTAGAQKRVGWALAADELTPGSEGGGLKQRTRERV